MGSVEIMKIGIGLPHITERIHTKFADSLIALITYSSQKYDLIRFATYRENITFARNKIATWAMENDCDYLLFIDDDMEFDPKALEQLLSFEKDIIGGLTFIRSEPHEPSIYMRDNDGHTYDPVIMWKANDLIEVDGIGMAFTLINMKVIKKIAEKSQFHNKIYGVFDNLDFLGEDLRFCKKAKEEGYSVFCDTSLRIGHIAEKIVWYGDYEAMAQEKIFNFRKGNAEKKYNE